MSEQNRKDWRELCREALGTGNPDELMEILQELDKVRRDFRKATQPNKSTEGIRC
jgi:hypothetical protein